MGKFSAVVISIVQLSATVGSFLLAGRLWQWAMARPMSEASMEVLRVVGSSCPAFRAEHNTYFCEKFGTTQTHPWYFIGLVVLACALFALGAYLELVRRKHKINSQGIRVGA